MKQPPKMSSLKKSESQKLTTKEQKVIVECAQHLRKIGDVFNFKYKLLDMLAKKEQKGLCHKVRRKPSSFPREIYDRGLYTVKEACGMGMIFSWRRTKSLFVRIWKWQTKDFPELVYFSPLLERKCQSSLF